MAATMTADIPLQRTGTRWTSPISEPLRHPRTAELRHIGGKRGLPLIGIMPEVLLDPLRFAERMVAKHGPVYRFHALGNWHVHVTGAEANELVLFDETGIFSAEEGWGQIVRPLFPGALLVQDGATHRANRRILGEAFRQAELSGYQRIFADDIEQRFETWNGEVIDPYLEARRLTFQIAASTFLGIPLDDEARIAVESFANMMGGLNAAVLHPRLSPALYRGLRGKARLEKILGRLIEEKRADPGDDFLSRICLLENEDGDKLSPQEIMDSFIFLLAAAHDTMASAITSLLYFLATEPFWVDRIRDELVEVGLGESVEAATAKLPVQEMFYKEALRLNGPAPVIWRRAAQDFSLYGNHIPAGTMTGANIMMTHRLESLWPDAQKFDPMRFTPEAERGRSRFAYAPFGAGVHKCLGMHFSFQQAKIFMTHLVRHANLTRVGDEPVRWYHWPNCRPRGDLSISVRRRDRDR